MDGTLAQNIARFEKPESSKVIAAATAAGIHDMILRFPKGYDTTAGEAGHLLSAGQRQRMALARSLYGDPSVFVFDEPNSNLDELGEQALLQTILGLKAAHKTVVLITHRPAILASADTLLVMHQGSVQWQGPKDQVLAQLEMRKQTKMST
jgi:ATP-binding cassette subfamily C exporter for protease/lipase